jgi:hypothetical protein
MTTIVALVHDDVKWELIQLLAASDGIDCARAADWPALRGLLRGVAALPVIDPSGLGSEALSMLRSVTGTQGVIKTCVWSNPHSCRRMPGMRWPRNRRWSWFRNVPPSQKREHGGFFGCAGGQPWGAYFYISSRLSSNASTER